MSTEPAMIEARAVSVSFGGVHALRQASLSVARGSLCGLIGPNGSGKSTFINVISCLTPVTSGSIAIAGEDYTAAAAYEANARGISRTFQTVRLLPSMDVLGNVMLGGATRAAQRSFIVNWLWLPRRRSENRIARKAALAALERVGMADYATTPPGSLPYGRQRRVEIARALASEPRLLLLDEPTAGMSHAERDEVGDLLLELRRDGLTQILVEHDLAMIHRVCDSAHALNFGQVIASGAPKDVAANPDVREAYLGHGAAAERSDAPQGLAKAGQ